MTEGFVYSYSSTNTTPSSDLFYSVLPPTTIMGEREREREREIDGSYFYFSLLRSPSSGSVLFCNPLNNNNEMGKRSRRTRDISDGKFFLFLPSHPIPSLKIHSILLVGRKKNPTSLFTFYIVFALLHFGLGVFDIFSFNMSGQII